MIPLISFIMPARNGAAYIAAAVGSLREQELRDWELIVVDDGSTDATGEIVSALRKSDGRIRLERSQGSGQVQALNHGFRFAGGRYIKTIDCDDLVLPDFSRCIDRVTSADATLHQALLLDANGRDLKRFIVPDTMVRMTLRRSLARIRVSPPRWSWTLSMDLARRVFPLPPDLPAVHEDVFYGLKIKKHAATMAYVPEPLYLYRQHAGQLFGGQYDYSRENVIRKARAMLAVMETVEASDIVEGIKDLPALLAESRVYYELMSRPRLALGDVLTARLAAGEKARILMMWNAPGLSSFLSRCRSTKRLKGKR
jgi:glycosyltransferase involved in cell wall biosynthesis